MRRQGQCRIVLVVLSVLTTAPPALGQSARSTGPDGADRQTHWFKGNLHTHSLWSDGNDFPEMICEWYKKHGYHFLALSDHNILSRGTKWIDAGLPAKRGAKDGVARYRKRFGEDWIQTRRVDEQSQIRLRALDEFRSLFEQPGRFLLIQSEEITDHYKKLPVHINAGNLRDLIMPRGGANVREVMANNLDAIAQQSRDVGRPMLGHVNHPNFKWGITAEDMAAVVQEQFFEVYNGHPGVRHRGDEHHPSVERLWDIANTIRIAEMKRPPLSGLATDDAHNYFGQRGSSPGRGWVMVRARELTPDGIIRAIQRNDFYASSGVTLRDVRYDADLRVLRVEIEPEEGVEFTTEFVGTLENYDTSTEPAGTDAEGKPIRATRRYSNDIGKVLATVKGNSAVYRLTGRELYVRAVVTSTRPPENPVFDDQKQQAWTQPVGWERWVAAPQRDEN